MLLRKLKEMVYKSGQISVLFPESYHEWVKLKVKNKEELTH